MVSIFTGFGAGVERGSANILGGAGQIGGGSLGRGGENVSVNAATGGLVISRRDEFLTGVGPDASVSRSYNSLIHTGDRDNGDNWQQSTTRRVFGLTGDVGTAGSAVQRLGADGSVINYVFETRDGEAAYWAIDGAGTHDRLSFNAGADTWTWTDGDSLVQEVYEAANDQVGEYRLTQLVDKNGQALSYSYEANSDRLSRITTQNGEWIEYKWNAAGYIDRIDTGYLDQGNGNSQEYLTRVYYGYDGQNRLTSATTDLTPQDQSITDSKVYTVTYTYDGDSNRISSITQTDGSQLAITYNAAGRIATLTQKIDASNAALDRTMSLAYHIGYTVVTAPDGTDTRLDYDAGGRLLQITTTAPEAGSLSQIRQFKYDDEGNVEEVIETEGDVSQLATTAETGGLEVEVLAGTSGSQVATISIGSGSEPVPGGAGGAVGPIGSFGGAATYASTGRGDNLIAGLELPEDPVQAPADGTLPAGWGGWNRRETTWKTLDAPYSAAGSNDTLAVNLANLNGDNHSGGAELSQAVVLDPTKAYENTFYFRFNSSDSIRLRLFSQTNGTNAEGVQIPTFKLAKNGKINRWSSLVDIRTTNAPYQEGKWYKAVTYILPEGTALLGSSKRGGIYDIETGQKAANVNAFIWKEDRLRNDISMRFRLGGLTGTDGSKGLQVWRPEIREVDLNAILQDNDPLDVAVDAQLLFPPGSGGSSGGTGEPGTNVPTGTIAGAPTITYDTNGRITRYEYDANGNVTKITDPNGNRVERFYDDNNNLSKELRFGSYQSAANTSLWSRFVYDASSNLRYAISADGSLTEYLYGANGLVAYEITYPENRYPLGSDVPTLSDVAQWLSGVDLTTSQINWTQYDARGNVITNSNYTRDADGSTYWGSEGGPNNPMVFTSDQAGQLLSRAVGSQLAEAYVYDGLGRIIASSDPATGSTSIVLNDAASQTVITTQSGAVSTSTYSLAGELLTQTNTGSFDVTGTASYEYDEMGRLRVMTNEAGETSYYVYDKLGRKTADVNEYGDLGQYHYNDAGRLVATTNYINKIASGDLADLADPNNAIAVADILPAANADDLWTWSVYDDAGRVIQTINGEGHVVRFEYDQSDRLVKTTSYFKTLTSTQINGFKAAAPSSLVLPQIDTSDTVSRAFYDRDGNLVGALDGEGYLTQNVYDEAGQLTVSVAYAQATTQSLRANGTFADLQASVASNSDGNRTSYNVYDGLGQLRYTVNSHGEVTGFEYDSAGLNTRTVDYASPISTNDYTFDNVDLLVQAIADPAKDRVSTSEYNDRGQVSSTINAAGLEVFYTYDLSGRVIKEVAGTGADARTTRYYYSAQGNLRYSIDAEDYIRRFDYDAEDRVTREITWAGKRVVDENTTIDQLAGAGTWVDVRYTYDAAGRRNKVIDGEGNQTLSGWHGSGLLAYVERGHYSDDQAQSYYVHGASGLTKYGSHARGTDDRINTYFDYDGIGNLASVEDPNGNTTTYTYDERGLVISKIEAAGTPDERVTTYEYNAFGEVVKVTDPRGNSKVTYYDELGRATMVIDAEGYVTETRYNHFGEIDRVVRHWGKYLNADPATKPTFAIDAQDNVTTFEYDDAGRLIKTIDAEDYVETYSYNAFGERVSMTAKSETDIVDDGANNVTTYEYDKRGLLLSETMPATAPKANGDLIPIKNAYTYDSRGNRISMTEGVGLTEARTTQYFYDDANRLVETRAQAREIYSQTTHTSLGLQVPSETISYDARGNVTKTVDASGATTIFYYDDLDRKVVEINAVGTYTAYEYDDNSNVTRIRIFETQLSVPANAATNTGYVGGSKEEAPDAPSSAARETLFAYDALNRLTMSSVVGVHNGTFNGTTWVADADNFETVYEYDANGNVVKTTDPEGNETFAYYDKLGRKIAQVDGTNHLTTWQYDSESNVVTEIQYANPVNNPVVGVAPGAPDAANNPDTRVTRYTYDGVGNRLTETREDIEVYDFTDANNNGMEDNPGTTVTLDGTVSYTYNGLGQVLTKTEATGDTSTYTYDEGGRLIAEARTGFVDFQNNDVTPTVSYLYDGLGNLKRTEAAGSANASARVSTYEYNDGGLLSRMTDAEGNVREYFYDASGRQLVEQYTRSGQREAALSTFDLLGRVVEQKTARWTGSAWDINSSAGADDGVATQTEYNAFGDVVRAGVNGLWQTENKYDLAGRMWATNSGDGVWKFFGYDKNGNQTIAITSAGERFTSTTTFQQAFAGVAGDSDANGISDLDVNATYTVYDARNMAVEVHEEDRQLTTTSTKDLLTTRTYNAFGEVTSETDARGSTLTYTYNTMGRMIRSQSPVVSITLANSDTQDVRPAEDFYYDLSGRLVAQRDANGVYDVDVPNESYKLKAEHSGNLTRLRLLAGTGYNGTEALVTQTIAADGGIISTAFDIHGDARERTDQVGRMSTKSYDDLGRVTQINHAGGLVEKMTYDELGQVLTRENNQYGASNKQVTAYDMQGRVVSSRAFGGETTTTDYDWNPLINGVGLNTFGGWVQTTTFDNTRTLVRQMDIYERETRKTDLDGQDTQYTYDEAGRLTGLTARTTNISYNYYNTGLVKTHIKADSLVSTQTVLETRFSYNATGDLVSEKLSRTTNQGPATYNYTHPTELARDGDAMLFRLFDDSGVDQDGDAITLVGFQLLNASGQVISGGNSPVTVTQSGANYLEITPNGNLGFVKIEYTLKDDRNQTSVGSISLTIASTPPVANSYGVIRTDTGSFVDIDATDLATDADGGPQPLKFVRSGISFPADAGISIEWLNGDRTMRIHGQSVTPTVRIIELAPGEPDVIPYQAFLSWTVTDGATNLQGQTQVQVVQGAAGANDSANLAYRGTALVNVLANDTVASGRTKTLTSVTSSNASVLEAKIENNQVRLTHKSGASGTYTVTYNFSDGVVTSSANVTVTIAANRAPTASNYNVGLGSQGSTSRQVIFGNDLDGHSVSIADVTVMGGRGSELQASVDPSNASRIRVTHVSGVGTYSVRYQLQDQFGALSNYAYLTVNVANQAPSSLNYGVIRTDTGAYIDIDVTDLASDPDGAPEPLKFVRSMVSYPSDAGISIQWLNGDRTMRIHGQSVTPTVKVIELASGEPDIIDYQAFLSWGITDGESTTSGQTQVQVSQGATAANDNANLAYRGTALVNVLANDTVAAGRSKTLTSVTSSNASVLEAKIENNKVRLTHKSGGSGTFTVTYNFTDGVVTRSATVNVTVAANRAPTAGNYNVNLGAQGSTSRQVIFGNDLDGHSVSIVNVTVLNGRGSELNASAAGNNIAISHVSGNGTYSVRYQLRDQFGATSGYGYVTVNVANQAPTAKTYGVIRTDTGAYKDIHVSDLASDPDGAPEPLKFVRSMISYPSDAGISIQWLNGDRTMRIHGQSVTPTVKMIELAPGEPDFIPYEAFISWGVTDGQSTSSGQTQVQVSQGAVANNDSATLNYRGTQLVNVLGNDVAAGNRSKTLTSVSSSHSSQLEATIQNNAVHLRHKSGGSGNYTVTYSFTDGVSTQTATVAVTVRANRAPTAGNKTLTLRREATDRVYITSGSDSDGHSVSITNISVLGGRSSQLTASVDSDPRYIRLTHVSGHGTYEVQYRTRDQYGAYSDYKKITVTVAAAANNNPIISNTNIYAGNFTMQIGIARGFNLAPYLSDPDGDTVRLKPGSISSSNGNLIAYGSGTYIQFEAFQGAGFATISYTVEDQKGGEASGQIRLNYNVPSGQIPLSAPIGSPLFSTSSLGASSTFAATAESSTPAIIDVSSGTPTGGSGAGNGNINIDWGTGGITGISGGNYAPNTGVLRDSTATYDALGRLTSWTEAGGTNTPAASKDLYYDANSNIRRSVSEYAVLNDQGGVARTETTDYWFAYDSLNRVVVDKGYHTGSTVSIRDGQGTRFEWDAAGQRKSALYKQSRTVRFSGAQIADIFGFSNPPQGIETYTWVQETKETYSYNDAGHVDLITIREDDPELVGWDPQSGAVVWLNTQTRPLSEMEYNLLGQQTLQEDFNGGTNAVFSQSTSYDDETGRITQTITDTVRGNDDQRSVTDYYYGSFGSHQLDPEDIPTGNVTVTRTRVSGDDITTKTSQTINSYTFYDNAVQNGIRYTDNVSNSNKITTTGFVLDGGGNVMRAVISDARNRTVNYTHDISGQVIERREQDSRSTGDPRDIWYRFGGKEMGHITNNGAGYHDSYKSSVAGRTATPGDPSEGAFHNARETGRSRGNFDYSVSRFTSYDQDSRAGSYTVRNGETLAGIAAQQYGDANLWYRIAQANGLSSAQAPLIEGQVLRLPAGVTRSTYNASTFQPYDPSQALGDVNPGAPTPPKNKGKCGIFGQILLVVVAVAVSVIAPVGGTGIAAAIANGALASVASQAVGVATGIQQKFSFKSVALSALSAGVTKGISGKLNVFSGAEAGSFKAAVNAAVNGAAASAITQGIGVATGLQSKFSFAGVAAAGVAAGVGEALGSGLAPLKGKGLSAGNIASHVAVGAARSIASAATRSAIEGSSFGKALQAGLPDVIGQVVGQALGAKIFDRGALSRSRIAELLAKLQYQIESTPVVNSGSNSTTDGVQFMLASDSSLETIFNDLADALIDRDLHDTSPVKIETLDQAIELIARHDRLFEELGLKENGFDIMYGLVKTRNYMIAERLNFVAEALAEELLDEETRRDIDELMDGPVGDYGEASVEAVIEGAAYIEVLGTYGPGEPTSDWRNIGEFLGDRLTESFKTDFYNRWQGRLDRRAAAHYAETGDIAPLQERTVKRYIREFNGAYEFATSEDGRAIMNAIFGGIEENFRLGVFTDVLSRSGMKKWFQGLGIDVDADPNIMINRRLYDSREENYRIPDLRIGDYTIEGTLWGKTERTPQIQDMWNWGQPSTLLIVNPYDHNDGRVKRFERLGPRII